MSTFKIPVVRTASRHLIIEVEADSLVKAQCIALYKAPDCEFPGESSAEYELG